MRTDDRAPGRGKGTQGALIAAHFDIPDIATGSRCAITSAADRARPGRPGVSGPRQVVPDEVVLYMVREAMTAAKAAGGGYVLDGIPRNTNKPGRPT